MKRTTKKKPEAIVAEWNRKYPPPTAVILTDDFGAKHRTTTGSEAWLLSDGTPVVKVQGRAGGYLLTRLEPIEGATTPEWVAQRKKLSIAATLLVDVSNEIRDNCESAAAPDFEDLYDTWQDLKAASELVRAVLAEMARDPSERKLVERS